MLRKRRARVASPGSVLNCSGKVDCLRILRHGFESLDAPNRTTPLFVGPQMEKEPEDDPWKRGGGQWTKS
nr:hypothetical protein BaRGS_021413 [Batillaria attramentaria]